MKSEKQKMLDGELYNALDEQLSDERTHTRLLIKRLNETAENQTELRAEILRQLIPDAGEGLWDTATILLRLWL
jgi:maltose O-acetyltransferase